MSESQELDGMSLEQLKQQADALEIKYNGNISEPKLRARILEYLNDSEGENDEEGSETVEENNGKSVTHPAKEKQVTIIISEDAQDKQPVYVGVNSKSYRIKRGVKATVPESVIDALNNGTRKVKDKDTGEMRTILRYPYQIVND